MAGDDDHWETQLPFSQTLLEFEPIHFWHANIGDHASVRQ
jgi:hypothetical protein